LAPGRAVAADCRALGTRTRLPLDGNDSRSGEETCGRGPADGGFGCGHRRCCAVHGGGTGSSWRIAPASSAEPNPSPTAFGGEQLWSS
jgi:hypothetical protein